MQLVPAVTELNIAEMLYLQHKDRNKPMYLYINSTGGWAVGVGGCSGGAVGVQCGAGWCSVGWVGG